jgi:cyanate permease
MLGIALGLSRMPFYTIGVFAPHLSAEFGWSMGQIMGGLTITTLMVPEYNLMAFFIARYFGLRGYTLIYGVLYVFFSVGAGFGPLLFGMDYDRNGDYSRSLIGALVVLIGAASMFLTLGPYRQFGGPKSLDQAPGTAAAA